MASEEDGLVGPPTPMYNPPVAAGEDPPASNAFTGVTAAAFALREPTEVLDRRRKEAAERHKKAQMAALEDLRNQFIQAVKDKDVESQKCASRAMFGILREQLGDEFMVPMKQHFIELFAAYGFSDARTSGLMADFGF